MWWVADCLSRPPEELSLPRSTQGAGVKAPSRSLATPVAQDGSSGASTAAAAVVPATQRLTSQETQDVLTRNCWRCWSTRGPTSGATPLLGPQAPDTSLPEEDGV